MDLFYQSEREVAVDQLHALTALYTHCPIVDELLDGLSWPNGEERLLDPSVGAGAFICRALERLLLSQPDICDARLVHQLQGWEIHPFAVSEARSALARILVSRGREAEAARRLAVLMIHEGDYLLDALSDERWDAIATNPPYLRMVNVPDPIRADYLASVPDYAQQDLLHSFLDRCAKQLQPDGEVALITADRWLTNEGAAKLRATIGETLGIAHLERVDVQSAFYRPKLRRKGTAPRVHPVLVVLKRGEDVVHKLGVAPIYPGADLEENTSGPTLGDVAAVKIAPWLGTPGIFVVSAQEAHKFDPSELVPVVDTDDIVNGVLKPPSRYALRTRKDCEPSRAVLEHLDANLDRMCERGRRAVRWIPPESFENFDFSNDYLLIPRIARTLRPIRVPAGILALNHNLTVVSGGGMRLDDLEALLSSDKAKRWVEARAPRLENGYLSITTRFLRGLPIG